MVILTQTHHYVQSTRHILEIEANIGADLAVESHGDDCMQRGKSAGNDRVGDSIELLERKLARTKQTIVGELAEIEAVNQAVIGVSVAFRHQLHLALRAHLGRPANQQNNKYIYIFPNIHGFFNAKNGHIVYPTEKKLSHTKKSHFSTHHKCLILSTISLPTPIQHPTNSYHGRSW